MSYECAHTDFSDTETYPALTRMGTPTTQLFDVAARRGFGVPETQALAVGFRL